MILRGMKRTDIRIDLRRYLKIKGRKPAGEGRLSERSICAWQQ